MSDEQSANRPFQFNDSRYKRKYVHKLLVNRLLKPAQEKCG